MLRRLTVLTLAVGAAVALVLARRRSAHADSSRNGGSGESAARLRRRIDEERGRLRDDLAPAGEPT